MSALLLLNYVFLFLLLVLSHFDRLGVGMECVLGHSFSEVSMVTLSECYVNGMLSVGVVFTGSIPDVFALVTCWFVRGANSIFVVAVGVDFFWVVYVVVDGTWSAVSPNIFANFCKASPWRSRNV